MTERGIETRDMNKEIFTLKKKLRDVEESNTSVINGSELSIEKLIIALERIERDLLGSKYIPNKLTQKLKTAEDLLNHTDKIHTYIKKISDREKLLKIKQFDYESKTLRYKILEKEIALLKKHQSLVSGSFSLSNIMPDEMIPTRGNKVAEYVRGPSSIHNSGVKRYSASKRLRRVMKENIESGKLENKFKSTLNRNSNIESDELLGKRIRSGHKKDRIVLGDKSHNNNLAAGRAHNSLAQKISDSFSSLKN